MVRVVVLHPTSRASARVRCRFFVNASVAIHRVGNREWGLRPPTRTTCPEVRFERAVSVARLFVGSG